MPLTTLDGTGGLLRLGVAGSHTISHVEPFDIGGAGTITNEQPFTIEAPYVGVTNIQVFDISGSLRVNNSQPFDLGAVLHVANIQPFDIIATATNPIPGAPQPNPVLASYTALALQGNVGQTQITVNSAVGISAGTTIVLNYTPPGPPPPPPPPPPSGSPAFLSRPASGSILRDGGSSVLIENVTIHLGSLNAPAGVGITVRNVHGTITIRDVDLADLVGGIYIYNCTGTITIDNVRSRNMGDGSIGAAHSNHIQLAECDLAGSISNSKFLGGRTEDMLSIWHSGGHGVGQELIVENNMLQGLVTATATARAWTSGSGTGIIVSDGAGSPNNGYVIVRNNKLLTPGQVGIQHIDGPGLQTYGNTIYGERRPGNNNPLTSWEGNPSGVVHDNEYYWTNDDGSHPSPYFSGYGSMVLTSNVSNPAIDVNTLRITL